MRKLLLLSLFIFSTFLQAQTFTSNENRVMLIELYTSQGCSSCPPADKWLSRLKSKKGLFNTFIPMAFHITYWDFLGWKDSFANKMHDNRQRFYANRIWQNRNVYTPQFVVDAKEYRGWFQGFVFPTIEPTYAGVLSLNVEDEGVSLSFESKEMMTKKVYVHMAILGFDYQVAIKAGENEDRVLEHDFVVLSHHQHFAKLYEGKLTFEGNLPTIKEDENQKAVVVWLSDENHKIIQAVGGYLKP